MNPPQQGEESYDSFHNERSTILQSMKRRARLLSDALNKMEGISCTSIDGAMYAFPTITIPPKAVSEAERLGVAADEFYCMKLLEETGIVVVPGSGFGQKEGTFHFRTTVLPQEEDLQLVIQSISDFHHKLLADYA